MNTEPPPILDPNFGNHPPPVATASLSRLGMWLSLVAPVVILLFFALKPG